MAARDDDESSSGFLGTCRIQASQEETNNVWFHVALENFAGVDVDAGTTDQPTTTANKPVPAVGAMAPVIG
jgi:hypothetical protein